MAELIRVRIDAPHDLLDLVVGRAFQWGAQGVEVCDQTTHPVQPGRAWVHVWHTEANIEDILKKYTQSLPPGLKVTTEKADMNWAHQITADPLNIGHGFVLNGKSDQHSHRVNIELQAGYGFGAGDHPTTRACVQAMEVLWQQAAHISTVADIGTGTGILAVVAAHLGAHVWATDIEDIALGAAGENCVLNGLDKQIQVVTTIPENQVFDLVIANLYAGTLLNIGPKLFQWTTPGGHCLISGITKDRQDDVIEAYGPIGFQCRWVHDCDEWVAITLKRPRR